MCQGVDNLPEPCYYMSVPREEPMNRLTQMTHEWLDTPVHELNDNTIMILKHELLMKVTQLNNELKDREEATGGQ